jgi:pyruvate formate lyase activating enzyme
MPYEEMVLDDCLDNDTSGNVYDMQRFAVHDGPGIRTNVFLKGCPLRCLWCHSPESQSFETDVAFSKNKCIGMALCGKCLPNCPSGAIGEQIAEDSKRDDVSYPIINRGACNACLECVKVCPVKAIYGTLNLMSVNDCLKTIKRDKRYYLQSNGGVTISGGEPMSQFVFCKSLARACRNENYHVALDTSGYAPIDNYLEILPFVDLLLYDLKHMDNDKHKELTGVFNESILKNAIELAKAGAHFQFRFPVIPGYNDSDKNIMSTAEFCRNIQRIADATGNGGTVELVQLLPYHNLGENKYEKIGKRYAANTYQPTEEFMAKQLDVFQKFETKARIG